ncbi:hypothetical protein [Cupriavidus pauculus]|uniref:CopL family metal-binding regulatory protein n=1 Tax=Cupriavidus pauculus TaxID=82633 RepID=A0A2N5C2U8_9BURK|nr:hypothetical protein [Cupriavidus pauculus]PLP96535.1 hypothetical protein CYJ10_31840 [Cupriavidus pauculus]
MKRLFASFLLCLAMFALPIQGAAAAVMMICSVTQAAGLSMPERHAAIKAEAEAEAVMDHAGPAGQMGQMDHAHCHQANVSDISGSDDMPVWHDAQPAGATPDQPTDHSHHAAGHCSACGACAASAMLLPEIPLVALQHRRHALPLATPASFASQLPLPADRPPARRC